MSVHLNTKMDMLDMMTPGLADKLCVMAAGCSVDVEAVRRRSIDLSTLRKLGEAYREGWLHNIMGRITPLTVRQSEDYVTMADVFIEKQEDAHRLMERFCDGLANYCASIGIQITANMTAENVSPELQAHVKLYGQIADLFKEKFDMESSDPLAEIAARGDMEAEMNPFMKEFVESKVSKKD